MYEAVGTMYTLSHFERSSNSVARVKKLLSMGNASELSHDAS